MPITQIYWDGSGGTRDDGADIHVLAGTTSKRLDPLLILDQTPPDPPVHASNAPPGYTVRFTPEFAGAPAAHGITVSTVTGEVTVTDPLPPGPRLRNFLIRADVTDTTVRPPADFHIAIRVHIHFAVRAVWLTPSTLTIHAGAPGQRLTVLALFDDDTVGDVTTHPGITWTSDSADIAVAPATGVLSTATNGASTTVTAVLPDTLGGAIVGHADATVRSTPEPWATHAPATLVPGSPGVDRIADVPNILVLPDGFTAAEQPNFEALASHLVHLLRTNPITRPYDLFADSINYWTAFIPSPERGVSVVYEMRPIQRLGALYGGAISQPEAPPAAATLWSLRQLIHEVGLPVPADGDPAVTFATKLPEWQALYGAKVTGPAPGVVNVVNEARFLEWRALFDRRLTNERDSALGLAYGSRPNVEREIYFPERVSSWNPRRTTRAHLDTFLSGLTEGLGGPTIGATWGPAGKDRPLVFVLTGGSRWGGARTPAPQELVACSVRDEGEVRLEEVPGTRALNVVPYPLPAFVSLYTSATVAHETSHALGLLDEYGGRTRVPLVPPVELAHAGNIQAEGDLTVPGVGLDGGRIKWLLPRITSAGVLRAPPEPDPAADFRLLLQANHGAPFRTGDLARLRQRPLTAASFTSDEVEITNVAGDELLIRVAAGSALDPGRFPIGSIVFVPTRSAPVPPAMVGDPLSLVAPIILNHINAFHGPLTAPRADPLRVCDGAARGPDPTALQAPTNLPAGLPAGRPRHRAWIVGLYEGGRGFDCGVFHPTGICIMRSLSVPPGGEYGGKIYSFCAVCKYLLVDRLDPTKHAVIDADYTSRYPQP